MREIKFRGFRTVQKDWIYGNLIVDENGTKYIVENNLFSADGHHLVYDPTDEPAFIDQKTVRQYTGMNDSNGEDIYEGDIVRASDNDDELAVVEWDDEDLRFTVTHGHVVNGLGEEYYPREVEVVGNIYDNPELLGGADDAHRTDRR